MILYGVSYGAYITSAALFFSDTEILTALCLQHSRRPKGPLLPTDTIEPHVLVTLQAPLRCFAATRPNVTNVTSVIRITSS